MMGMVQELMAIAITYSMITNAFVTSDATVPNITNKMWSFILNDVV